MHGLKALPGMYSQYCAGYLCCYCNDCNNRDDCRKKHKIAPQLTCVMLALVCALKVMNIDMKCAGSPSCSFFLIYTVLPVPARVNVRARQFSIKIRLASNEADRNQSLALHTYKKHQRQCQCTVPTKKHQRQCQFTVPLLLTMSLPPKEAVLDC